jgi:cell division septation protein DedD
VKSDELDEIFSPLPEEQKKKETSKETPAGKKVPGRTAVKSRAKKNNPVFNLVALIVAVLVIIMGIVIANDLGYLDSMFGSADTPAEVMQSQPQPQSPVETAPPIDAADEPESEEMPAGEDAENESVTQEQPDPSAIEDIEQPDNPEFGLYGTAEVIDERYYSIILHSVRSENRAREVRDELQNEGYRSVITSVNSEDLGTMWRVGIGQFETIPDAQNAAVELPQEYRDNHFIGLIQ